MLLDALFVLYDLGDAGVGRPVRGGLVVERDVDMCVVLDLLELGRDAVRDEDEVHLRRRHGWCVGVSDVYVYIWLVVRGTHVLQVPSRASGDARLHSVW